MKCSTPEWHQRLTSTNDILIERVRGGELLPDGFVLAAHEQTAGRGRLGRRWVARPGCSLTFSLLLRGPVVFPAAASLPMATALGVATALEALGIDVQTKWPNDLLVCQRKICGILAERCAREAVVVGVGLNVNMRADEAAEIDQPATSIAIEKGETYDVREALGFLLPHIETWIARWHARGFAGLQEAWAQRCAYLGASVRVRDGRQERTGILQGFGPAGQLLLREEDGRQREVWVGDLSAAASENT